MDVNTHDEDADDSPRAGGARQKIGRGVLIALAAISLIALGAAGATVALR